MLFFGIFLIALTIVVWTIKWQERRPGIGKVYIDTMRVAPFWRVLVALTALPAGVTMIVSYFS